jgi:hypothetical protein
MGEADIIGADIQNLYLGSGGGLYTCNALDNIIYSAPNATAMSIVNGLAGDDILREGDSTHVTSSETFNGGDGNDTVDYSQRAAGVFVIMDGANYSGAGAAGASPLTWVADLGVAPGWWAAGDEDALSVAPAVVEDDIIGTDVENVIGTPDRDLIIGNDKANSLQGGGNTVNNDGYGDTLCGMGGVDELFANATAGVGGASNINSLHGYDCPYVVSVSGATPAAGDHTTPDSTESDPNSCYNIGGHADSNPDLSVAGWSAATVGIPYNCRLSAE